MLFVFEVEVGRSHTLILDTHVFVLFVPPCCSSNLPGGKDSPASHRLFPAACFPPPRVPTVFVIVYITNASSCDSLDSSLTSS